MRTQHENIRLVAPAWCKDVAIPKPHGWVHKDTGEVLIACRLNDYLFRSAKSKAKKKTARKSKKSKE